jgi:4-hydroxy-2-oxoheptanedioate aldolase
MNYATGSVGLLTSSTDLCMLDSAGRAGLAYVWLDAEHTGLAPAALAAAVRVLRCHGTEVHVRVPSTDFDTLVTYANTGVDEVVLPRIQSLAEVQAAWASLSFPPTGCRPRQVVAATGWGSDYAGGPRLSVIIETIQAVEALPELTKYRPISHFWIGHKDLTDDYQRHGSNSAEISDIIAGVVGQLETAGSNFGWAVTDPDSVTQVWKAGGARCALYWDVFLQQFFRGLSGG